MAPISKPTNIAFEIVFDPDQAKLGGLPFFGFVARVCHMPPDENPEVEELAERGREAITDYLNELCQRFDS